MFVLIIAVPTIQFKDLVYSVNETSGVVSAALIRTGTCNRKLVTIDQYSTTLFQENQKIISEILDDFKTFKQPVQSQLQSLKLLMSLIINLKNNIVYINS